MNEKVLDVLLKDELGKFFSLIGEFQGKLLMPDSIIDEKWHDLLENEKEYREFCDKYCGEYVEHIREGGFSELSWVSLYEKKYGSLNVLWFVNSNNVFNESAYKEYLDTGIVKLSWHCNPYAPKKKKGA